MQVCSKNMPVGSLIIGIDLVPIRPIRGCVTLQEDITTPQCRAAIKKVLKEKKHDMVQVVLHDGSPNVGGAWSSESSAQTALVLDSLKLATDVLCPGGTFVTKIFRSQDYNALLFAFKQLFEKVEVTKPIASRATSAEIYVICQKYRAPAKIDPRLLDAKHLFKETIEAPKVIDVMKASKQKRHREGYEEGTTVLRKEVKASDFVWSEKPLDMLGSITSMSFKDPDCKVIKEHDLTTDEIKILCEDLRVLGKTEFKQLLKWRLQIRKNLEPTPASDKEDDSNEKKKGSDEDDDDEEELATMEELKEYVESQKRKERKKKAKAKEKAKARSATGMQIDVMEDGVADTELFNIKAIKGKKDLARMEVEDDEDDNDSVDEMLNDGPQQAEDDSDFDPEQDRQRYDQELDQYFERAYSKYCSTTDGSTKRRRRAKLGEAGDLWEDNEVTGQDDESDGDDVIENADEDEANPLVVPLAEAPKLSTDHLSKQWFSQDVFDGVGEGEELSDDEEAIAKMRKKRKAETDAEVDADGDEDMGVGASELPAANHSANGAASLAPAVGKGDFEIAPQEGNSSSDSDSDSEDDNGKAEILAYAKKMLKKKNRESILDDAYNRYTFNDEDMPRWFADDEKKHNRPEKPITKEEVEAMKAQFREINARPVKKVAEAKARKKRRVLKKLEQARQKATAIADQEDISNKSKQKSMERVYKKALAAPKRGKTEVVVAKKGVGARGGKGRIVVDRRLRKDSRAKNTGKPGKGFKGRGGGANGAKAKANKGKGPSRGGKGRKPQKG